VTRLPVHPPSPTMSSMAAAEASRAAVSSAAEALSTSALGIKAADSPSRSSFGLLGRVVLSIFSVLPTVLYWVTYTLPAWLFTLFSMSLTFTMNFTTLYVTKTDFWTLLNQLPGCLSWFLSCPPSVTL
jgi:hypothetical protein